MKRKVTSLIVLASFLLLSSSLLQTPTSPHARLAAGASSCPSNSILRMTLPVPPSSLNSLTFTTGSSASYLIGLMYLSAFPVPKQDGLPFWDEAVTDWITHNSQYTQWNFNVKPGLKWSDGTNVTSQDIISTFGPNFAFNSTYDFPNLAPEVNQEYTTNSSEAVFVLNQPDAHWAEKISWLYFSAVYPRAFISTQGPSSPNLGTSVVDGPFYPVNYSAGTFQMRMLRNTYYKPLPQVCEIDANFVDSIAATATYLQSGSTDLAPVALSNSLSVAKTPNVHLSFINASGVQSLEYNVTVYPYSMTAFRQALVYGINESQIVKQALNGFGQVGFPAEGAVPPQASDWYNPNTVKYSFNPTQATALLSTIGIAKGSDGFLQYPNKTDITLTIYADTDNPADVTAASIVQNNLQALGFRINVVTTSEANIIGEYSSNVNNIARLGMILYSPGVPVFGNAWLNAQPGWDTYFAPTIPNVAWENPPNVQALYQGNLSGLIGTADPSQEKGYLANIQALNAQYLPTIILGYPDAIMAYSTAHWINWPSSPGSGIQFESQFFNMTAFANLAPAAGTSSPSGASSTLTFAAIAIAAVVIAAVGVLVVVRRRR